MKCLGSLKYNPLSLLSATFEFPDSTNSHQRWNDPFSSQIHHGYHILTVDADLSPLTPQDTISTLTNTKVSTADTCLALGPDSTL